MEEKDVRALVLLVTVLVFFPVWIGLMWISHHGILHLEDILSVTLPRWFKGGFYLLLFGGLFVGMGYRAARWLDRRYPNSPSRSAAWEDAN